VHFDESFAEIIGKLAETNVDPPRSNAH
jgi:hypothetical protein